jgi:hypothetical protein
MSKRSVGQVAQVLAGLVVFSALGGCGGNKVAYAGPGWYLEKPRLIVATGPQLFAGPFTYEKCEAERMKLTEPTASNMLCIQEFAPPPKLGPY